MGKQPLGIELVKRKIVKDYRSMQLLFLYGFLYITYGNISSLVKVMNIYIQYILLIIENNYGSYMQLLFYIFYNH